MHFLSLVLVEAAISTAFLSDGTGKQQNLQFSPGCPTTTAGHVHRAPVMSCDDLTLSCFLLSCQLSGQTKWTPPVTKTGGKGGGIYGSMQAGGHHTLLPPFLRTNPFKGGTAGCSVGGG